MSSPVVRIFVRSSMVVAVAMTLTGCIPVTIGPPPGGTQPPTTPGAVAVSEPSPPTATATVPSTWEETNALAANGVVKFETADCQGRSWIGSGFLISPNLIVTAAHVVEDQSSIDLVLTDSTRLQSSPAEVLGIDSELDLALVRSSVPFSGHVFTFSQQTPKIGQEVAALGFPLGYGYKMTRGGITGFGEKGSSIASLEKSKIQTDASINGGNSGGPLVYLDGVVAGIVVATLNEEYVGHKVDGFGYAVDATIAAPQVEAWRNSATVIPLTSCASPKPTPAPTSQTSLPIVVKTISPSSQEIANFLLWHALSINRQDYEAAFADFTTQEQAEMGGLQVWSAGQQSSAWQSITLETLSGFDTTMLAGVSFRTYQDAAYGYNGQTCSDFSVNYTLVHSGGRWLIESAKSPSGFETPRACVRPS